MPRRRVCRPSLVCTVGWSRHLKRHELDRLYCRDIINKGKQGLGVYEL